MSGYVRNTQLETNFQGETVKATLAPLSFGDFVRLRGVDTEESAITLLSELLPKYVKEFGGLVDATGQPISIEEVCGSAYFFALISELGKALLGAATPKDPSQPSVPSAA